MLLLIAIVVGGIYLWQSGQWKDSIPGEQGQTSNQDPGAQKDPRDPAPQEDPLLTKIKTMTLEEKIGQLAIVGINGLESDIDTEKFIRTYHVGGFIIMGRNVHDHNQLLNLINSLKRLNHHKESEKKSSPIDSPINSPESPIPLFLAVDEEGGRVSRMPPEIITLPANQKIGELNNEALSYQIGSALGREVKAFGLNLNFAPVMDIFSNPKNTVIGDRSFGSTPEIVGKLGVQTMKGIQDQGVISVVKHFPGHGDTVMDSHMGLPVVQYDLEHLRGFELLPFRDAINQGADAVMTAHILLPKIDSQYPASFSRKFITEILRQELGFKGVVITDDLTMGAIMENYDIGEAAVRAIQGGSDLVLICHDPEKMERVLQALLEGAINGEIPQERIDESVYRILSLKEKYNLKDEEIPQVDVDSLNGVVKEILREYPSLGLVD
ncbi:MAG: beta-N-acetylhexosaminidase [Desulfitobacterium sp.]|nr:beta-N-acetylhexosaminidase [Desulfitobacterium sp.]